MSDVVTISFCDDCSRFDSEMRKVYMEAYRDLVFSDAKRCDVCNRIIPTFLKGKMAVATVEKYFFSHLRMKYLEELIGKVVGVADSCSVDACGDKVDWGFRGLSEVERYQ